MKKFFALALALALTFAMAVTCFAATAKIKNLPGTAEENITITYSEGGSSAILYGVDVVFEDMNFTYTAASQGTWDIETHTYKDVAEATWNKTSATVKVTNHSNAPIVATVAYEKAEGYEGGVQVEVEDATLNLGSAVGTAVAEAPNAVATVKISGDAAAGDTAKVIGTITVSIAAPQ